jgi:hypothetical protein
MFFDTNLIHHVDNHGMNLLARLRPGRYRMAFCRVRQLAADIWDLPALWMQAKMKVRTGPLCRGRL